MIQDFNLTREGILEKARMCICGDRDHQYGSPEDSFKAIAGFWETYLKTKCVSSGTDVRISAEDVAAMMTLFKIARIATGQNKDDNWIDGCGYLACGGELSGRSVERN